LGRGVSSQWLARSLVTSFGAKDAEHDALHDSKKKERVRIKRPQCEHAVLRNNRESGFVRHHEVRTRIVYLVRVFTQLRKYITLAVLFATPLLGIVPHT
jgi:hypothetical protein